MVSCSIAIVKAEGTVIDKKACSADFVIGIPSEIEKFTPKKRED